MNSIEPGCESPEAAIIAERAVLGLLLYSLDDTLRAAHILQPQDFHHAAHQKIFQSLTRLAKDGQNGVVPVIADLENRRELEAVGGHQGVFALTEGVIASPANLEAHVAIIREAAAKRTFRHAAWRAQEAAENPSASSADIQAILSQALEHGRPAIGASRFAEAAIDASAFKALPIEPPRSLIGDGVLVSGGFAMLYGKPGLGKSWLLLTLLRSIARGEPWMGIPVDTAGARCGLIQLELSAYRMQQRLNTLAVGSHGRDSDIRIVCRPHLTGVIDLYRKAGDLAALREWIIKDSLNVLAIDALSRAHTADENKAEEMGAVLSELDSIRHETACAILLVHHETKSQEDPNNHLDVLRGTGRLQSDPTLHIRVHRAQGVRCIRFARVTEGAEPEPVFYIIGEDGQPVIVKSPESVKAGNVEKVFHCLESSGTWMTRAEIQASVNLTERTVSRHVQFLVDQGRVSVSGTNRDTKYAVISSPPGQPRQEEAGEVVSDSQEKRLYDSWS